jgi:hypothetical protein
MRFVELKTIDELDMQTLDRSRERLVSERTAPINQLCKRRSNNPSLKRPGIPAAPE